MSHTANIILASFMIVGAIGFGAIGIVMGQHMPSGPLPFYGFAAFCVVIAIACLAKSSRPITLRIIGAVIFTAYAVYVIASIGKPQLPKAIAGFCVFGIPSGYVAIFGMYPIWGRASGAFRRSESNDAGESGKDASQHDSGYQ